MPTKQRPLPVLLAHVLLDINRDFERGSASPGEQPSLVMWANLLRAIPDEGIPVTELSAAARISRRAVRAWLLLENEGLLETEAAAPRAKVGKLTEKGLEKRDNWGELVVATEERWTAKVSGTLALRTALEAIVGQLDLELPHYPMVYGASDTRALGGAAVPAKLGPPRIPAHGADWAPVVRAAPKASSTCRCLLSSRKPSWASRSTTKRKHGFRWQLRQCSVVRCPSVPCLSSPCPGCSPSTDPASPGSSAMVMCESQATATNAKPPSLTSVCACVTPIDR